MNIKWILLLLVLLSTIAPAQVFRSYSADDSLLHRVHLTKRRELIRQHRPDGTVESECEYHNGRRDGLYREFYPDGFIKAEILFRNGREDGTARFYSRDGIIVKKVVYERGKIEEQHFYDDHGRPIS